MGTMVPDIPYPFGDNCVCCDNPSGLWDPGETPKKVLVMFWDVITDDDPGCIWFPFPNGRIFVLEQDPVFPCIWKFSEPLNGAFLQIDYFCCLNPGSFITMYVGGIDIFQGTVAINCQTEFTNLHQVPGLCWYQGRAKVWFIPESYTLCHTYNLYAGPGTMYEMVGASNGNVSINLASHFAPMSTQILFDPQIEFSS